MENAMQGSHSVRILRLFWYYVRLISLDIVKVRLQTTSQYSGALDGATQILKNEGPTAFYKVRV